MNPHRNVQALTRVRTACGSSFELISDVLKLRTRLARFLDLFRGPRRRQSTLVLRDNSSLPLLVWSRSELLLHLQHHLCHVSSLVARQLLNELNAHISTTRPTTHGFFPQIVEADKGATILLQSHAEVRPQAVSHMSYPNHFSPSKRLYARLDLRRRRENRCLHLAQSLGPTKIRRFRRPRPARRA